MGIVARLKKDISRVRDAAAAWHQHADFKTGPDFASTSIDNSGSTLSLWPSQDKGEMNNIVYFIGYVVEGSLFIIYVFIENDNLCQHLRDFLGKKPLSWSSRLQIALDSARGLEYIHEHINPAYIHCDIKSANILDKNFILQVADFGLRKLVKVGAGFLQTQLVGTFGYMSPGYSQRGVVSTKIDLYAFGVVLYKIISAKEAIVEYSQDSAREINEDSTKVLALVVMFEEVMNQPNPSTYLQKLVHPRLGENNPMDQFAKIAQLAKACTLQNHVLRPSMRSTLVALTTLTSGTGDRKQA
ncbi:chitin elicitor receptor kinase 1-like [Apium graveolens]|uniref:chitin elicitor receptor kinase 1-like n=1 Tax=Apium graveolens TaxID=4045 RepID=UPI003D7B16EC